MRSVVRLTLVAVAALACLQGCQNPGAASLPPTQHASDYYVEGQLALDREDYDAALAELKKAIAADPSLSVAHAAIGDIYRKQGKLEDSATAYEQAVTTDPYAFGPQYNLGVVYQMLSDAANDAKAGAEYVQKAVDTYVKALALQPDDFDTNLNLCACYFQQGKYDEAETYCRTAIKADPKNPFGPFNLAMIYKQMDRPYDAIWAFKDSLELDINQPKLLVELGNVYMKLDRLKDAQKAFELASQQDPESGEASEQMGQVYYYQKRHDDAVKAYEKAVKLNPKSSSAYRGLGIVYMTQFITQPGEPKLREKGLEAWNLSLEYNSNQEDLVKLVRKYTPALSKPSL